MALFIGCSALALYLGSCAYLAGDMWMRYKKASQKIAAIK